MTQDAALESIEISAPPAWFDRWSTPAEFAAAVDALKGTISDVDFMCRSEAKPMREAWAAARYATILSGDRPVSIQLERDRFPDFNLRVRDELQLFEIVEADQPGRRRTEEYRLLAERKTAGLPPEIEEFDPKEEQQAAIPAIVRAIEAKAAKRYRPAPHLLVYVNFWLGGEPPTEIWTAVESAERHHNSFAATWLLWGGFIIRLWPRPAKIRERPIRT